MLAGLGQPQVHGPVQGQAPGLAREEAVLMQQGPVSAPPFPRPPPPTALRAIVADTDIWHRMEMFSVENMLATLQPQCLS